MLNKKKLIISLVAIAVLLPVLHVVGITPLVIQSHSLSPDISAEDLTQKAELVVKGKLVGYTTELQYSDNDLSKPMVFTNWELEPKKFLKGSSNENPIIVKTLGGEYNNIRHIEKSSFLEEGNNVILFLTVDPDSIYGDSYYITGISSGHYKIFDDGKVKNSDAKKDTTEKQLEKRIEKSLSK